MSNAGSPTRRLRTRPTRTSGLAGLALLLGLVVACGEHGDVPTSPAGSSAAAAPAAARPAASDAEAGRWRRIPAHRLDPARDAEQLAMIERLEAIGYASASTAIAGPSGLRHVDPDRSDPGFTFMTSGHAPEAFLVDAAGRIVHRWRKAYPDVFEGERRPGRDDETTFWRRARLLPDGHVIAIFDGLGVLEVDASSALVWARANGAHHDLDLGPDREIYVLTREAQLVPEVNARTPILEDFVEVLDRDGRLRERFSLLEAFERSPWADVARSRYPAGGDLLHMNALARLEGRLADAIPAFRAGNLLVSSFPLHLIAVVDVEQRSIAWLQRGRYRNQHDPQVLANGNLLLFDNRGGNRGDVRASAVLELDPATGGERWAYRAEPPNDFYSATCGAAQRLANGNTLVTESDRGRAFEVTPDGEIVWDYRNPHRAGPDGRFIATLFEAWRLPADFPLDWLPADAGP